MSSVTVTASTGPGIEVTALVIDRVTNVNFDIARGVMYVQNNETNIKEYDMKLVNTIGFSIFTGDYTITVAP